MSKLNLFCLPYSGASAMVYSRWRQPPDWLEVRPVELPGRGARLGEPLQTACTPWPGNWLASWRRVWGSPTRCSDTASARC